MVVVTVETMVDLGRLRAAGLRPAAQRVMPLVAEFPLGTVGDFSRLGRVDKSSVYAGLWDLHAQGLAEMETLGCTDRRSGRWWINGSGLDLLGLGGLAWHQEWSLRRLLSRLSSVEWFYRVVGDMDGFGPRRGFGWFGDAVWDAAVRFEGGWAAIFWSGVLQTERRVRKRFEKLVWDLDRFKVGGEAAWPGLLVFVVWDRWQGVVVRRAAEAFSLADRTQVVCVEDGGVAGASSMGPSTGWVFEQPGFRDVSGWSLKERAGDSLWSRERGNSGGRVMSFLAEWPGMNGGFGAALLGDLKGSKWFARVMRLLFDLGLAENVGSGKRRYGLSGRGSWYLAGRDRVPWPFVPKESQVPSEDRLRRMETHVDGVYRVCRGFVEGGGRVVGGWRSRWAVGRQQVSPDGVVYLRESPYGEGWHYLEYERRARGAVRVSEKMKGYLSERRVDGYPVLVVARDEGAEGIFQALGRERGLRLVTTTVSRVDAVGVSGNDGCWSSYGRGVVLR